MTDGIPLFSIRGLSKVFSDGVHVLDGIDLDIFLGECLFVAGSNGSGKTILMRILAGLLESSEGTILFRGAPLETALAKTGDEHFRRELGLVFQDPAAGFMGETVEEDAAFGPENLGMDRAEVERRVAWALAKTGLGEKRLRAPRQLSGGEKRRLAAAGILAMGCKTIIMDEPFANLDLPGVIQTLEIIKSLKNDGATLVILTHELEKALAFADRLVILHRGRIMDKGRPEEVLNRLKPEYGVRDPRRSCGSARDCSWLD